MINFLMFLVIVIFFYYVFIKIREFLREYSKLIDKNLSNKAFKNELKKLTNKYGGKIIPRLLFFMTSIAILVIIKTKYCC